MTPEPEDANSLKEKGNSCIKENKYEEAVLHYTYAIKLDSTNHSLYSNRSLAFLKLQQYYFALEDAKETIRLRPDWAKGYFRKGEVEYKTSHFTDALISYKIAATMQPNDSGLLAALEKTKLEIAKDRRADNQVPWVGAGVGIIIGVVLVIADQIFTHKPTLVHPLTMAFTTIAIAMIGYGIAFAFRHHVKNNRASLLDPPPDLFNQNTEEKEEKERENRPRYSKAQARHRFKKGRS